jgi:hypothetical protein
MARQMFAKGGAAFPDLSGDGKVTQKDILMGRGVLPMAEGGDVPGDVRAIFQGLVDAMRGSKSDVAKPIQHRRWCRCFVKLLRYTAAALSAASVMMLPALYETLTDHMNFIRPVDQKSPRLKKDSPVIF